MRTIALILAIACICRAGEQEAQENPAVKSIYTYTGPSNSLSTLSYPKKIVLMTSEGEICIDLKTGAVSIPNGTTMDSASKEFWRALEKAFPYVARAMLEKAMRDYLGQQEKP